MNAREEIVPYDEQQLRRLSFIVQELSIFYFLIVFFPDL